MDIYTGSYSRYQDTMKQYVKGIERKINQPTFT